MNSRAMNGATESTSCLGFTTDARTCQRCRNQQSPSLLQSETSNSNSGEAILDHQNRALRLDNTLGIIDLDHTIRSLSDGNGEDTCALATNNMTDTDHNYNKLDNQQEWSTSFRHDQGEILGNSANNTCYNMDLKQHHQSMESDAQRQDSADFWASLAGDIFAFPYNHMDITSSAGTFDPHSSYSDSTVATSVEPDTEKFRMTTGFQGLTMSKENGRGYNHCVAIKSDGEGDWLQGLCTGVSHLPRPTQQSDASNMYSDIGSMAAEPDLSKDWPILIGSEATWEQDAVGMYDQGDLNLDTDFGQSNLYPPLPDLAPLTEFDSFTTHDVDQNTNPLMPHCPDPELISLTQQYSQTVIPSIENNERDLTWNVTQPHHRESSTSSTLGRTSQTSSTRKAEDEFLLDCKDRRKMSYRAIKALGGFREAESTLRGRYRTLSKLKEERVRKPEWSERDVSSLVFLKFYRLLRS